MNFILKILYKRRLAELEDQIENLQKTNELLRIDNAVLEHEKERLLKRCVSHRNTEQDLMKARRALRIYQTETQNFHYGQKAIEKIKMYVYRDSDLKEEFKN